jgi:PAS domain S-box-containing protein
MRAEVNPNAVPAESESRQAEVEATETETPKDGVSESRMLADAFTDHSPYCRAAPGEVCKFFRVHQAYARAQAVAHVGSWHLDLERNELSWTEEAHRIFGRPIGPPLTYETFLETVHPDDRAYVDQKWQAALRGEPYDIEHRIVVDGQTRWIREKAEVEFDAQGRALRGTGISQDITERKVAAQALQASEERFRQFFEDNLAGNFVTTVDGTVLSCNTAFAQIFGFSSMEEAMACNMESLYPSSADRLGFLEKLKSSGQVELVEAELRRKDGRPVQVVENARAVFNENGELTEIRGFVIDETARKTAESQLRQAQKMETVGRLAGGVAHDFNNLIGVILGYSELLEMNLADPERALDYLREIEKASRRAAGLTRQLLAFSRQQILAPHIENLNTIVADTEGMLRRLIGEDIELTTRLHAELWPVLVDRGQMEQVILNLAANARDAMPTGGNLTIETGNAELDAHYAESHYPTTPGKFAMLAVSDTGCGMDAYTKSHVFEPFFTTKEMGKGTGLGLATVYGIVKQSGGFIWVYSEPGCGSTFKVYLPQAVIAEQRAAPQAPAAAVTGGSEIILLVEDEEALREMTRRMLESSGYAVLTAEDPAKALEIAQQRPGEIRLLLTDVVMPGMGGRKLAEQMVATQPRARVLYISGYTDNSIVHHGVLSADVAFLQKPYTRNCLLAKVREVLDSPPVLAGERAK